MSLFSCDVSNNGGGVKAGLLTEVKARAGWEASRGGVSGETGTWAGHPDSGVL